MDDDDRHDIREPVVLRNDKMVHDVSHDCRNQRAKYGGMIVDGDVLRKALRN